MSKSDPERQRRIEQLKQVIRGLHEGDHPAHVKQQLAALVRETTSDEIVAMENQLIDEGMDPGEIKSMCDLHSQVMREVLVKPTIPAYPIGHPVDTFLRENDAVREIVEQMREVTGEIQGLTDESALPPLLEQWREGCEKLLELDKHYARKENILFSHLERHGIDGPSQVMWAKDDDIREMLKAFREALTAEGAGLEEWKLIAEHVVVPLLDAVSEMIYKEENILLPMALEVLEPEAWGQIHRESRRFGYCLVKPNLGYVPAESSSYDPALEAGRAAAIALGAGQATGAQLQAIFPVLPMDLTFVDADDRVAFFTEGKDRVFERVPSVIGRKVHNCHPPKSVHIVEKILASFRSGEKDVAEFWIQLGPRFVHIRYFAVRSREGEYLGCLEVTQDLTPLRALEGERRLLAWEEEEQA